MLWLHFLLQVIFFLQNLILGGAYTQYYLGMYSAFFFHLSPQSEYYNQSSYSNQLRAEGGSDVHL